MTRCTFTFLFCVCASFALRAQEKLPAKKAILTFDHTEWNFGTITQGESVEHTFRFANAGNEVVVIQSVTNGGGGFLPLLYPKEPIAPGDSGFITFRFNSTGKIGPTEKIGWIVFNTTENAYVHMSGYVRPKPASDAPVMKFDSTTYWFDTVYQGSIVDHEFRFTNTGKTPLIISMVTGSSGSIVPYYPKEPIAPGQSAIIRFVFNTTGKYGPQHKTLTVLSNASEPTILLNLKGFVTGAPPFNQSPAPVALMKIDTASYHFGTITIGDTLYHDFIVKNTGKEPLIITSVMGSDGGAACQSFPREPIRPGGSGVIRIIFLPSSPGYRDKLFAIRSNNPSGDVYIHVMGTVVAKGNK